ncbi:MAG: hypothetical protein ABW036_04280 [Flavitalea sp.]
MAKLTAAQAAELSKSFLGLAQTLGNYRFTNWDKLSKEENQSIADQQWSVLDAGENMTAMATTLLINEADTTIRQIRDVATTINEAVAKIKKVHKVIYIGTAVIQLAAVILVKQPLAIPGAINDLIKAVK